MFDWLKSWRESRELKKLVRQRGTLLKQRYGFQEFYSPEQVSRTAAAAGLDQQGEAYAIAMYVQPTDAIRILTIMRDAKWANEIRKIMIGPCFGFSGGNDGSFDRPPWSVRRFAWILRWRTFPWRRFRRTFGRRRWRRTLIPLRSQVAPGNALVGAVALPPPFRQNLYPVPTTHTPCPRHIMQRTTHS
jgi:hypothetical protein